MTQELPDLARFSRDPSLRAPRDEPVIVAPRRDVYRERNVLGGLALVVALVSIPATAASAIWPMNEFALFFIGGVPIGLSLLGLVASFKLGFPTRMAWLAVAISIATMGAGFALSAQQAAADLRIPTVQDVPGVGEITELQNESGLGG